MCSMAFMVKLFYRSHRHHRPDRRGAAGRRKAGEHGIAGCERL